MAVVELVRVSRTFGDVRAVDGVSLAIEQGEFFSILGPSGCGKTTLLRLIAGLEQPDGGYVSLEGEPSNHVPPYQRDVGMVFQNYALFPHLDVEANVGFGLQVRRTPKANIRHRVRQALELVQLDPGRFSGRFPSELSGGQRQRVALARALVLEPGILLLDEPLGAIDLKMRQEMQLELKALNRRLGTTFIYVTHDQDEALAMSDRIAVMNHARLVQVGTPAEVYETPKTAFAAHFIGSSTFVSGVVGERQGQLCEVHVARDGDGSGEGAAALIRVPWQEGLTPGSAIRIAIRPERIALDRPGVIPGALNTLHGAVQDVVYHGSEATVVLSTSLGGTALVAVRNDGGPADRTAWRTGDAAVISWRPEHSRVLDGE